MAKITKELAERVNLAVKGNDMKKIEKITKQYQNDGFQIITKKEYDVPMSIELELSRVEMVGVLQVRSREAHRVNTAFVINLGDDIGKILNGENINGAILDVEGGNVNEVVYFNDVDYYRIKLTKVNKDPELFNFVCKEIK